MPTVIVLAGPSASGKTQVSIQLAQALGCDIISVDSAMVYRQLNIGTAKPDLRARNGVRHRLIDVVEPEEQYSVFRFVSEARRFIADDRKNGKVSLLVGGSMMYLHALLHGFSAMPKADSRLRRRLEEQGAARLHSTLRKVDPVAAARIDPADEQRIIRALEVWHTSGKGISDFHQIRKKPAFSYTMYALKPPRARNHASVRSRFHTMLEHGFEEEVVRLRLRPKLTPEHSSMRCVGYRQWWQYLDGLFDRNTAIEKTVAATNRLVKRQSTWLNKFPEAQIIDSGPVDQVSSAILSAARSFSRHIVPANEVISADFAGTINE